MGLSNSSNEKQTFVNVVGGKFSIAVDKNTEGAVSRKNKKDVTVYELQYDTLEKVKIIGIEKKIGDFGASYEIKLKEVDEEFILNLPYSGRITNGLTFRLPNINFEEDVTLKIYEIEGKNYLVVYQNGKKVDAAFSKENPNGLPTMEMRKVKGVDTWDDTKQGEFIENMIVTMIQPKLGDKKTVIENELTPEQIADSQDLPF